MVLASFCCFVGGIGMIRMVFRGMDRHVGETQCVMHGVNTCGLPQSVDTQDVLAQQLW
jgi:hypothetical protein